VGGMGVAHIISFLAVPLMTRLYSPEQFGIFTLLLAIINPLSAIACGRYDMTVVLAKDDKVANNIVFLSYCISIFFAIVAFIILFFYVEDFSDILYNNVWYLIPLFIITQGVFQTNNYWLQKKEAFKTIAGNKIFQTTAIALFSLFLGYMGLYNGLTVGYFIGWFFLSCLTIIQLYFKGFDFASISFEQMKEAARKFVDFPLYNGIPALLNTASVSIPIFIILNNYSETETGYFGLTRQVLAIPTSLIAAAFSQVFYQRVSFLKNQKNSIKKEVILLLKVLSLVAFLMTFLIGIFGPILFKLIFGSIWGVSGKFAQILIFAKCIQFIVLPVATILPVLDKIRLTSIWQIVYFLSIVSLYFFSFTNINSFLIAYAGIDFLCYAFYLFLILKEVRKYEKDILK